MRTSAQSQALEPAEAELSARVIPKTLRLGGIDVEVGEIGVVQARAEIPSLIRESARTGRAFHIRNAKNPHAATALLISPETFEALVLKANRQRTLGVVLDALPFGHTGAEHVAVAVPDNRTRALRVPAMPDTDETAQPRHR